MDPTSSIEPTEPAFLPKKMKIILDTDPGIDDLLAIMLAEASPECELLGVTTVSGNCHVTNGSRHALGLRRFLGGTGWPVCMGCHRPLARPLRTKKDLYGREEGIALVCGEDWQHQVDPRHAVHFLLEQVNANVGELTLFPLGPLTNIAAAMIMDPSFAGNIREIILMGGAARVPGNAYPTVEFNFMVDPEAAAVVFESETPITMVGLDVTGEAALAPTDASRLESLATPRAKFVLDLTRHYLEARRACVLYDPLAVAIGLQPALLLEAPEVFVAVETRGDWTAGTTVCDFRNRLRRPHNARVATRVDVAAFLRMFWERVVGEPL